MFLRSKTLWLLVAAAVVVTSVGMGTVRSYIRTAHTELGRSIRDTVPIAFELKRLEQMTRDLVPEIRANQKVAAQLDVEIEYLQRETDAMEASQQQGKTQMQKLRAALVEDRDSYEFGGRTFTPQQVEQDLGQRLKRYDDVAVQLAARRRILDARKQTLTAAGEKIRQYQQQHDGLAMKAKLLTDKLKLLELAQEAGDFQLSHSKLNQAKELARELEKRIRTVQRLVEGQRQVSGEIPVDADTRPVTQQYDEYFVEE